jgi:hypothetical protein
MKKVFWKGFALCAVLAVMFFTACENGTTDETKSSEKAISAFSFGVEGEVVDIDEENHLITVSLPAGSGVTHTPQISVSSGAAVSPVSGTEQDFLPAISYTVTAEDGTEQIYTVALTSVWQGVPPMGGYAVFVFKLNTGEDAATNPFIAEASFTKDHTQPTYTLEYNSATKEGSLTSSGWAPGAFTYDKPNKRLTFTNYGGHDPRYFTNNEPVSVSAPEDGSDYSSLTDLNNTVWQGMPPMGGWAFFVFKTNTESDSGTYPFIAEGSFTKDHTNPTYKAGYTAPSGELKLLPTGWAPGPFTVINNGDTLKFTNYGGHDPRYFKKLD